MPPCNDACPAGENIQGWLYEAEEGGAGYERAWRRIMEDNPFPAIMGRVCYHPCETACNRGQLDEAVGINSVERFVGDEAIRQGWTVSRRRCRPSGRRVLVVGAARPASLRPTTSPGRPRRDHQGGGADGRRHDALRHPPLPPLPRRARRRGAAHPRPRRHPRARRQGHRPRRDPRRVRRGLPRRRRPARQAGLHPRRLGLPRARRRRHAARRRGGREAAAGPAGGGLRRRQHRDGRGPDRQAARRRPRRSWSTAGPRTGCRPTSPRSPRPRTRACSSPG